MFGVALVQSHRSICNEIKRLVFILMMILVKIQNIIHGRLKMFDNSVYLYKTINKTLFEFKKRHNNLR